jgi:hypothetical protein
MSMNRTPLVAAGALALIALLGACGGSTSSSPALEAVPGDPAPETHTARIADACSLVDRLQVEEMVGTRLLGGVAGAAIGTTSRCEFDAAESDGTDVAFQVDPSADGPFPSGLNTREGFEDIFGPAVAVTGLPLPAYATFDTKISPQSALLATDGHQYVLVTLTGPAVNESSQQQARAIAAAIIPQLRSSVGVSPRRV